MIEQIHEVKVIVRTFRQTPADTGLIESLVTEKIKHGVGIQMNVAKCEAVEVYRQDRPEVRE